jgi:flavin reductase (DIM6/NTAB) family NADH-FMN oxidoreductase RutF
LGSDVIPMEKLYRLLYPMNVVLISSSAEGKDNVMTAAWCFPLSADPPLFGVSISPKRYSHGLIEKSKEFVINIPDPGLIEAVRLSGENSGRDADKFELSGLTKERSEKVGAPSIKECMASIECRVVNSIQTGDHTVFVGEAVNVKKRGTGKRIVQDAGGGLREF